VDRGVGRGVAAMRAAAADWISTRFGHSVEPPNLVTRERSSSADRDGGVSLCFFGSAYRYAPFPRYRGPLKFTETPRCFQPSTVSLQGYTAQKTEERMYRRQQGGMDLAILKNRITCGRSMTAGSEKDVCPPYTETLKAISTDRKSDQAVWREPSGLSEGSILVLGVDSSPARCLRVSSGERNVQSRDYVPQSSRRRNSC